MTTTQLDRRRDRSEAAAARAGKARAKLTELENRLQTNAELTQQQTEALRNAEAEVKRLKRVLKTQKREQDRLLKAKTKATANVKAAERRAANAEGKYDKSVLAGLVGREKERDRAAAKGRHATHSTPVAALPAAGEDGPAAGGDGPAAGGNGPAAGWDGPAAGGDGPAAEQASTATARATAARITADKAD